MKQEVETVVVKMSNKEREKERKKIQDATYYGLFVGVGSGVNIDDAIIDLSDDEFCKMTKVFKTRCEYIRALHIIKEKLINKESIPDEWWNKILQTREDYTRYMGKA